eukprot:366250-Chlamydomonas_euryale.AAC.7
MRKTWACRRPTKLAAAASESAVQGASLAELPPVHAVTQHRPAPCKHSAPSPVRRCRSRRCMRAAAAAAVCACGAQGHGPAEGLLHAEAAEQISLNTLRGQPGGVGRRSAGATRTAAAGG